MFDAGFFYAQNRSVRFAHFSIGIYQTRFHDKNEACHETKESFRCWIHVGRGHDHLGGDGPPLGRDRNDDDERQRCDGSEQPIKKYKKLYKVIYGSLMNIVKR